jgi:hypothetical protein
MPGLDPSLRVEPARCGWLRSSDTKKLRSHEQLQAELPEVDESAGGFNVQLSARIFLKPQCALQAREPTLQPAATGERN